MSKKIQLTIPTPCHEDWENMLPADKGKFCQSCSKEVIDFTEVSDSQLVAFFKKPSTGSVCGRFQDYQLDRQIMEPRKKLPWIKYFFQFALPAFLISTKVNAQRSELQGEVVTTQPVIKKGKPVLKKRSTQSIVTPEIKGRISDEMGLPVPYASIIIKGTQLGGSADSNGYFSIKTEQDDELITLLISSVGFEQHEELIKQSNIGQIDLLVKLKTKTMEGIELISSYTSKGSVIRVGGVSSVSCTKYVYENILKDTLAIFSTKFSIYPNPVNVGNSVVIQNKKLPDDLYSVQFINISGQLIHSEQQQVNKSQNLTLDIPFVPAGAYFIKLTGRKKGKTYSEKLIIR